MGLLLIGIPAVGGYLTENQMVKQVKTVLLLGALMARHGMMQPVTLGGGLLSLYARQQETETAPKVG